MSKEVISSNELQKIKAGDNVEEFAIEKIDLPDFQISKIDLPKYGVLMDEVQENTDADIIVRLSDDSLKS